MPEPTKPDQPAPEMPDRTLPAMQQAIADYLDAAGRRGISPVNAIHIAMAHIHDAVCQALAEAGQSAPGLGAAEGRCQICDTGAHHRCPQCGRAYCRLCWGFHICLPPAPAEKPAHQPVE